MGLSIFSGLFGAKSDSALSDFCEKLAALGAEADCLPPRSLKALLLWTERGGACTLAQTASFVRNYLVGDQPQQDEINEILITHNIAPKGVVYRDIIFDMQERIEKRRQELANKQHTIDLYSRHSGDLLKENRSLQERLEKAQETERVLREQISQWVEPELPFGGD